MLLLDLIAWDRLCTAKQGYQLVQEAGSGYRACVFLLSGFKVESLGIWFWFSESFVTSVIVSLYKSAKRL